MSNPLEALVPELAAGRRATAPSAPLIRSAWVAQKSPLQVRFAADTDPTDAELTPLVAPSTLQVGHRVLILQNGPELVLLGRVYPSNA